MLMALFQRATQPAAHAATCNYRESHRETAIDYERRFTERPYRALLWEIEREVLDRVLPPDGCRQLDYLDFACGTGRLLRHLTERMHSTTGVDVSASMLAVAERSAGQARLVEGDITRDPVFPPASFDVITAFRFFPRAELELREAAMRALRRLLRPGGVLVFNNHVNSMNLRSRVKRVLGTGHLEGMHHQDVERLAAGHGLEIERVYPIGLWPGKESAPAMAIRALGPIERVTLRWPALAGVANDVIYVCRAGQAER